MGCAFLFDGYCAIFFGGSDAMLAERNSANLSAKFPLGLPIEAGIKSSEDLGKYRKGLDMKPTGIEYYGWPNFHLLMRA